jgi:hypothetical protein
VTDKRAGGRESAESGARPAPRREPRPARVVQPTVPCEWPQDHATKVESTDRLLPLEAPASTGPGLQSTTPDADLHRFSTGLTLKPAQGGAKKAPRTSAFGKNYTKR